jgi:fatty-acyl-CoA synthase
MPRGCASRPMSSGAANHAPLTPLLFFERAERAFGERIGLVDGPLQLTYGQLGERIRRLAGALRAAGVARGDRVAVLAMNGPVLLESHFGIPLIGAVLVAINTRLASAEIEHILRHSGARVLLLDAELAELARPALAACPGVELVVQVGGSGDDYADLLANADAVREAYPVDEDDPISINYTSGTTGQPKGVLYTHRGAYLNALNVALQFGLGPSSVYLWTLPMFHCNGWCFPWGATAAGVRHVSLRRPEPALVWAAIADERVTHFCAAPTVLIALANHPAAQPVERAIPVRVATGGAPPSPTTIAQMNALGMDVTHLYGMTETYGPSIACDWWPEWDALSPQDQALKKARQGVPHAGVAGARVVDEQLCDVPADGQTMGELVIRGNTVMAGYYLDPQATEQAFRGGWFHTGDLGVVHPDGYIELRDRAKDVIISGGENISTIEVEQVLLRHPGVLEVAVVGVPDERWGEVPKAFVTLKEGAQVEPEELVELCRQHLARFKAPKAIEFGPLPKTSTGKIQKFALREREWAGRTRRIN